MGTSFFKNQGQKITGTPANMQARAIGSSVYASRGAGATAQKDIAAADAINKAGKFKPMKRSAAYPQGPKV